MSYCYVFKTCEIKLQGNDGESQTDGCLKLTCKNGVWRPSIDQTVCCYDGEAFTPGGIIIEKTGQDGCTISSIRCVSDIDNKAEMVIDVSSSVCLDLEAKIDILEQKVDNVEQNVGSVDGKVKVVEEKVDSVEGKMHAVEGKLDTLKPLLEEFISKSGNNDGIPDDEDNDNDGDGDEDDDDSNEEDDDDSDEKEDGLEGNLI